MLFQLCSCLFLAFCFVPLTLQWTEIANKKNICKSNGPIANVLDYATNYMVETDFYLYIQCRLTPYKSR